MNGDWRVWRPAIWLTMLGIALILLVSPPYIGAAVLGGAIGVGIRILQRRRSPPVTASRGAPPRSRRR